MNRHDAEIIVGLPHIGLHKLQSVLEVCCPDTPRLIDQKVDGLVFVAPDCYRVNQVGTPETLQTVVVGVVSLQLRRHGCPAVVLEV